MKIPFYTFLGPLIKRRKFLINTFCSHPVLSFVPIYVWILGVLGVILSIFDIWRIIKCGSVLPGYLWRERMKRNVITPEAQRDCKLICLVLSVEYYFFLIVGLVTNNPIFYMPFLILYAIIITLEVIVFFSRVFADGLCLRKRTFLMTILMLYNWSSVACTFARSMSCCDM
ncbi:hypothetical protein ABEB36_009739 [Hypothenemus hampei]|uniref:Uncharacterized protein n=1 Tax=Hypothenemus hampei TaxID=57062 RepID=A0ABD1EHU3_HYPHA